MGDMGANAENQFHTEGVPSWTTNTTRLCPFCFCTEHLCSHLHPGLGTLTIAPDVAVCICTIFSSQAAAPSIDVSWLAHGCASKVMLQASKAHAPSAAVFRIRSSTWHGQATAAVEWRLPLQDFNRATSGTIGSKPRSRGVLKARPWCGEVKCHDASRNKPRCDLATHRKNLEAFDKLCLSR